MEEGVPCPVVTVTYFVVCPSDKPCQLEMPHGWGEEYHGCAFCIGIPLQYLTVCCFYLLSNFAIKLSYGWMIGQAFIPVSFVQFSLCNLLLCNNVITSSLLSVRKLEHWSHFSLILSLQTLPSFYLSLHFPFMYCLIDSILPSLLCSSQPVL